MNPLPPKVSYWEHMFFGGGGQHKPMSPAGLFVVTVIDILTMHVNSPCRLRPKVAVGSS